LNAASFHPLPNLTGLPQGLPTCSSGKSTYKYEWFRVSFDS